MTSLTESRAAFESRATEVGLAADDIAALTGSGITSLARLAFAAVQPGAQPSNDQVRELFGARSVNAGVVAATKRLIFESHTLVVADLTQKVEKGDDPTSQRLNPAARVPDLQAALSTHGFDPSWSRGGCIRSLQHCVWYAAAGHSCVPTS